MSERRRDPAWLDGTPALAALRDDPAFAKLGLDLLDEEDARAGGEAARERYAGGWHLGVLWRPDVWEACGEIVAPLLQLASGPKVLNRNGVEHESALFVDPARPDELLFAPAEEVPPVFWIPVAPTVAALRDVLAELHPTRRVPRDELTHVRRAFMGFVRDLGVPSPYSGEIEAAGPHELDRHFHFSPFVDARVWGTSFDDDPWREEVPAQPGSDVMLVALTRERRKQADGAVAQLTRRTLFSRAHLAVEIHREGLYIWEVRYRPSRHAKVIEAFNQRFGVAYPTDLPFDVVGAILGFDWVEAELLEARLPEQTELGAIAGHLRVLGAIRHSDLSVTRLLRKYLDHEAFAVRATIANLCSEYNWEFLLEDLAMREDDPRLVQFAEGLLGGAIAPPQYNHMGEPPDVYAGVGGGDEDDEDEDEDGEEAE